MVINLLIHRFFDCTDFPEGAHLKVKEKMSTTNVCKVTCPKCKARVLDSLGMNPERNWQTLSLDERAALDAAAHKVERTS